MREGEEGWGKGGLRTKVAELLNPLLFAAASSSFSPFTVWRHIDPKPKEQPQATEAEALPRELRGRKKKKKIQAVKRSAGCCCFYSFPHERNLPLPSTPSREKASF